MRKPVEAPSPSMMPRHREHWEHSPVERAGRASKPRGNERPACDNALTHLRVRAMAVPRRVVILALGLALSTFTLTAAAQAPQIGKPRPAPGPSTMSPLPPAQIDDKLSIGGDDINARQVETRMTVEVQVNGRGPYHFVVDSGADTSAVGLRIARDLQLPVTTPAILNGMTSRELVDRVRVAQFTLGPSTFHNLEMPALREVDLGGDGLIGIDALVRQRLMMDFEKHVIKVEDAL